MIANITLYFSVRVYNYGLLASTATSGSTEAQHMQKDCKENNKEDYFPVFCFYMIVLFAAVAVHVVVCDVTVIITIV